MIIKSVPSSVYPEGVTKKYLIFEKEKDEHVCSVEFVDKLVWIKFIGYGIEFARIKNNKLVWTTKHDFIKEKYKKMIDKLISLHIFS